MPNLEFETEVKEPDGELLLSVPRDAVAIWSGEWDMWWRGGASGYTRFTGSAGVYTRDEAHELTRHCGPEKKIEIKPHPYAGCDIYRKEATGSMPMLLRQTLTSDDDKYKVRIEYELSTTGLVIHSVKVV